MIENLQVQPRDPERFREVVANFVRALYEGAELAKAKRNFTVFDGVTASCRELRHLAESSAPADLKHFAIAMENLPESKALRYFLQEICTALGEENARALAFRLMQQSVRPADPVRRQGVPGPAIQFAIASILEAVHVEDEALARQFSDLVAFQETVFSVSQVESLPRASALGRLAGFLVETRPNLQGKVLEAMGLLSWIPEPVKALVDELSMRTVSCVKARESGASPGGL